MLRESLSLLDHVPPSDRNEIVTGWVAKHREPALIHTTEFAADIGVYLGPRALVAKVNPRYAGTQEMVERLLAEQPRQGILCEAVAYRAFIKGVIFGAKESAWHGDIGSSSAPDFAQIIAACWNALYRAKINDDQAREIKLGLLAFHWLTDDHHAPDKDGQVALANRLAWWKALEPLARRIIDEGSVVDVFDLIFEFRQPSTVKRLGIKNLHGIVDALATRVAREPVGTLQTRTGHMECWPSILQYGAELLESIALNSENDPEFKERIFTILQTWSRPPLSTVRAVEASIRLRK